MIFSAIDHSRTADAVIGQIESLILDGVLRSGDRLPAERDLAKMLDVSRPILRAALDELARRELIVTRHGGGTYVADVIGEVFRQPVVDIIRRHPKARADYLEFRRSLDETAAGLAAERATAADRALLSQTMDALAKAHADQDAEREASLDVMFHMAISDSAHNIVLLHSARACYRLLADAVFYNRSLFYDHADHRHRLFSQHRAIFDAIMAEDPAAARLAAGAHMLYVAEAMKTVEAAEQREKIAQRRLSVAGLRLEPAQGKRGVAMQGNDELAVLHEGSGND